VSSAVLSIGTTHPWNIAGAGLDIQVIREYGLHPLTVVAAVSAQDERGLHALHDIPPEVLTAQLTAVREFAAVRIGAVGSEGNAEAVASWLQTVRVPVILDPVMSTSAGGTLATEATVRRLLRALERHDAVLTPNADEAAVLTGKPIRHVADMRSAAGDLRALGIANVLLKGGHVHEGDAVVDVLAYAGGIEEFEDGRLPQRMRGTGCTLAAALACELAAGADILEAVERARRYVRAKIAAQPTYLQEHTVS